MYLFAKPIRRCVLKAIPFVLFGTRRGTSMSNLARAGNLIGLELVGMRLSHNDLMKANKPLIAHLPRGHYVVIEQATRKQVTIIDPASGITDEARRSVASPQISV